MLAVICDVLAADREILLDYCARYARDNRLPVATLEFENTGPPSKAGIWLMCFSGWRGDMEAVFSEYITCVIEAAMTMVFCLYVTRDRLRKRVPVLALTVAVLAVLGSGGGCTSCGR